MWHGCAKFTVPACICRIAFLRLVVSVLSNHCELHTVPRTKGWYGPCTPAEGREAVIRLSTVSPQHVSLHERICFHFQCLASLVTRKLHHKRGDLGPLKDIPAASQAPGRPI